MALIALHNFNLQTCMRSNPLGLHVWFSVRPFIYFHTLCLQTAKALVRLGGCAVSAKSSLFAYAISTIISWAGSFEQCHGKTCLMPYANIKAADQAAYQQSLISAFIIGCLDGIIHIHVFVCLIQNLKTSCLHSWGGRFVTYLAANPRRQVFSWCGSFVVD